MQGIAGLQAALQDGIAGIAGCIVGHCRPKNDIAAGVSCKALVARASFLRTGAIIRPVFVAKGQNCR